MTREETKKCIEVMQAYVEGKEIECRWEGANEGDWRSEENPHWYWNTHDYRKKPQPMKVTEEEKILLKMIGKVAKAKDSNYITIINNNSNPEVLKDNFYFLNVETQEWEDWSGDTEELRHHYNGGQS